ncbi:MAG TPA: ABC transporter permease [Acidimicrobiales bacterium]|jgi:branched-subunit amino acid ABC-type transport system permease component|nr:ABC transporter permease [Acidimicrobiales bacterium]
MSAFAIAVVLGLATGSIYSLTAMGLVLTYKTSGIFNFGQGAIAAASAYFFYTLRQTESIPWPLAALITVGLVGVLGGCLLERMGYALRSAPVASKVVATVGLFVAIPALLSAWYGTSGRPFDNILPTQTVHLFVNVGVNQIIIFALATGAALGLSLFFRRTRLGIGMQAVVDDPDLLALEARNPVAVRRWAWVIGTSFAAVSGILIAPTIGLDAPILTLLVVQAFGAAAIGSFTSIPRTYLGGLIVGVATSLSQLYLAGHSGFQGFPPSMPFLILFVVLLLSPKRLLLEKGARLARRLEFAPPLDRKFSMPASLMGLGLLIALPQIVGFRLPLYMTGLTFVILFSSLGLLVRTSGQVSLCHLAFAAVGASSFAHFSSLGVPWLLAVLFAGLITMPIGAVLAIPAIRLPGIYLAIATFGFGILLQRFVFTNAIMFGFSDSRTAPRPHLGALHLGTDTGYYYVILAVTLACCALVVLVQRSRLGRLLRALGDSPVALDAHGTNTNLIRLLVFCISAGLAGIAGALSGPVTGFANGLSFDYSVSLLLIAVLALAGRRTIVSAFIAGALIEVVPGYITNATVSTYIPAIFGLAAIAVAIAPGVGVSGRVLWGARSRERSGASPVLERTAMAGVHLTRFGLISPEMLSTERRP